MVHGSLPGVDFDCCGSLIAAILTPPAAFCPAGGRAVESQFRLSSHRDHSGDVSKRWRWTWACTCASTAPSLERRKDDLLESCALWRRAALPLLRTAVANSPHTQDTRHESCRQGIGRQ